MRKKIGAIITILGIMPTTKIVSRDVVLNLNLSLEIAYAESDARTKTRTVVTEDMIRLFRR